MALDQVPADGRSLLIFAGGRATRLAGRNKALLEVGGQPIIERILASAGPLASERLVLANDTQLAGLEGIRLIYDPEPHAGVLPALAAGLSAATSTICLAVACDMPFVSRALFEHLLAVAAADGADVVIPRTEGFLQPMHAVYRRAPVLRAIRAALDRGQQRMTSYFDDVVVRQIDQNEWQRFDAAGQAFFNVNTPDDLAEAQRLASGAAG